MFDTMSGDERELEVVSLGAAAMLSVANCAVAYARASSGVPKVPLEDAAFAKFVRLAVDNITEHSIDTLDNMLAIVAGYRAQLDREPEDASLRALRRSVDRAADEIQKFRQVVENRNGRNDY
jgi:hypothetical protein